MLERPDAVLAVIPLLAASGIVLRTAIAATGIATGLLAAPLATLGWVAALSVIGWELLAGPVPERASEGA